MGSISYISLCNNILIRQRLYISKHQMSPFRWSMYKNSNNANVNTKLQRYMLNIFKILTRFSSCSKNTHFW